MPRQLQGAVVVITGASSGIGRAAAIEFAKQGCKVVLAARGAHTLRETASQCEELGAETLVVPTDVSEEKSVQELARRALSKFGRLDVWVNNAGVNVYSRFEDMPAETFRQILETNLFGAVYGARSALAQFRKQQSGVLINVSSQLAFGGSAYHSAYAVSKYGIRALGDVLRQELLGSDIHVCTVYPTSTDTPFFQHAGNRKGRKVQPLGSVHSPEQVAAAMVEVAQNPKPDKLIGRIGYIAQLLHWFAPQVHARVLARVTERDLFQDEHERANEGNLFKPSAWGSVRGGWQERQSKARRRVLLAASVGGATLALFLLERRRRARPAEHRAA